MSNPLRTGTKHVVVPRFIGTGLLLALLSLVSGCASKTPINYYRLAGPDVSETIPVQAANQEQQTTALWPVRLADELDRKEIVRYHGSAEVKLSARNLWAGSLQDNVDRVLYDALQGELRHPLWRYPWEGRAAPSGQLRVRIDQLGGGLADRVVLDAQWSLQGSGTGSALREGRIRHTEAVLAADYAAYVEAINRALLAFAVSLGKQLNSDASGD